VNRRLILHVYIYIHKLIVTSPKAQDPGRRDLIAQDLKEVIFLGTRLTFFYEYIYIYISVQHDQYTSHDPQFNLRIQYLLSKAILPIPVNELENLYTKTFRLDFSPLVHCNKTEKAIIISTVPTVIVLSRLDKNVFFWQC